MINHPEAEPRSDYLTIWDGWIRIWHWFTVGLIIAMWATAEFRRLDLHVPLGIAFAGMLVFRIVWGFTGSSTARFATFLTMPGTLLQYLKAVLSSAYKPPAGHSPIGAFAALALILALAAQVVSGLFSVDTNGLHSGPLAQFITFSEGRLAGRLHEVTFNILLALIVLHLAAVLFYTLMKRASLIGPMLTGRRKVSATKEGERSARSAGPLAILASLTIAAGASALLYLI